MTVTEHMRRIQTGDLAPRVIEYPTRSFPNTADHVQYTGWTPTWEGPARPDYAAALADLNERR